MQTQVELILLATLLFASLFLLLEMLDMLNAPPLIPDPDSGGAQAVSIAGSTTVGDNNKANIDIDTS